MRELSLNEMNATAGGYSAEAIFVGGIVVVAGIGLISSLMSSSSSNASTTTYVKPVVCRDVVTTTMTPVYDRGVWIGDWEDKTTTTVCE